MIEIILSLRGISDYISRSDRVLANLGALAWGLRFCRAGGALGR